MANIEEILLPDVGGEEVEIIEICVKSGDSLKEEDAIITVETDKASMDIPATFDGKIVDIKISLGDKITQGAVICTMNKEGNVEAEVKTVEPETIIEVAPIKEETAALVAEPTKSSGTKILDIFVPDIGEDGEVDVIEVLVKVGSTVEMEDGLITLETDKATMDVPSPLKGEITEILLSEGSKAKTGTLVARIRTQETSIAPIVQESKTIETKVVQEKQAVVAPITQTKNVVHEEINNVNFHASPSVRKLAREFDVNLTKVKASGRKNRITCDDVKIYIKQLVHAASAPSTSTTNANTGSGLGFDLPKLKTIDFSKFGDTEIKEFTKIQKISGPSLHRNWVGIPHITQFDEADITELENFRKEQNALALKKKQDIKISPLIFIIKALAKALEIHPLFNSSLSEDQNGVILKKYINIAVAVDTPNGLVVPVIKNANKKGIHELAAELAVISKKARDGKLKIQDIQGACMTISSLGGIGGTAFTPIINAPEVAILGVSKSEIKPKWNGSEFVPKLMLPMSLSYDHRVIDGAEGARFSTTVANMLSDIRLLLI